MRPQAKAFAAVGVLGLALLPGLWTGAGPWLYPLALATTLPPSAAFMLSLLHWLGLAVLSAALHRAGRVNRPWSTGVLVVLASCGVSAVVIAVLSLPARALPLHF